MAIALDTTADLGSASNSKTTAYTCTGSDLILFVVAFASTLSQTVTSVTYNGVNLTQIDSNNNGGSYGEVSLWYLLNPATGSHNVVITSSSGVTGGFAASYTGVKQSGQPDANGTDSSAATTSYTQSITTVADNCWIIWGGAAAAAAALTPGSNTTIRQTEASHVGLFMADTNAAQTPAGSKNMNVTSSSQVFYSCMASFSPSAPANSGNMLLVM